MKKFFYYTNGNLLPRIIKDGVIRLSEGFTDLGGLPCIDVSTNQVFNKSKLPLRPEKSFNVDEIIHKGYINNIYDLKYETVWNIKDAERIVDGFYRIELDPDLEYFNWNEYKRICKLLRRIHKVYFDGLAKYLIEHDSLKDALFCMIPILKKHWIEIEKFNSEEMSWSVFTKNDCDFLLPSHEKKMFGLRPISSIRYL
jgi:hypothetical protein